VMPGVVWGFGSLECTTSLPASVRIIVSMSCSCARLGNAAVALESTTTSKRRHSLDGRQSVKSRCLRVLALEASFFARTSQPPKGPGTSTSFDR